MCNGGCAELDYSAKKSPYIIFYLYICKPINIPITEDNMKIVFLDAYAANPGDIDWAPWQQLADPDGEPIKVEIHDRTAPEDTLTQS